MPSPKVWKGPLRAYVGSISDLCFPCPEYTVGNTVRKVLHHIREEYHTASQGTEAPPTSKPTFSIAKFVSQGQPRKQATPQKISHEARGTLKENNPDDPDAFARTLKPVFMEAIQDVFDELETVYDNISKNAKDHIHSEYVVSSSISWCSPGSSGTSPVRSSSQ